MTGSPSCAFECESSDIWENVKSSFIQALHIVYNMLYFDMKKSAIDSRLMDQTLGSGVID